MKTQSVRLLDVFVIGPMMLRVATDAQRSQGERLFWIVTGLATIIYNGANYLRRP